MSTPSVDQFIAGMITDPWKISKRGGRPCSMLERNGKSAIISASRGRYLLKIDGQYVDHPHTYDITSEALKRYAESLISGS